MSVTLLRWTYKYASAGISAKINSICVVPDKIGHVGTKNEVSTLAMLDYILVTIKKLNGQQYMESTWVTGLQVSKNIHGKGFRSLNLLATYTI